MAGKVRVKDGFIMTIPAMDDHALKETLRAPTNDSDEESQEDLNKEKSSGFNPNFTFDFSDGTSTGSKSGIKMDGWDFAEAKKLVRKKNAQQRSTVDDKVALHRQKKAEEAQKKVEKEKEKSKKETKKRKRDEEEEEEDEEEDEEGSEDESEEEDEDEEEGDEMEIDTDELDEEDSEDADGEDFEEEDGEEEDDDDEDDDEDEDEDDDEDEDEDEDEDAAAYGDEESESEEAPKKSRKEKKVDEAKVEEEEEEEKDETRLRDVKAPKKAKKEKKDAFFSAPPAELAAIADKANTFDSLNISRPLLKAIVDLGWQSPTPVQKQVIPIALAGRDVAASAATGSGKTGAFLLPILERLLFRDARDHVTRVLILLPTRELAVQCHSIVLQLSKYAKNLHAALILGGLPLSQQTVDLKKRPDVIVATPGRLLDHLLNTPTFSLDDLEILVLDEADRLLELGFAEEIKQIVKACPKGRHTMLFSATMTEKVSELITLSLHKPVRVTVDPLFQTSQLLVQEFVRVRGDGPEDLSVREATLLALCSRTFKRRVIVFCQTKLQTHRLKILFALAGLKAAELHGNLNQLQRLEALEQFRDGEAHFLLATDLASRGLDIQGIRTVINFTLPNTEAIYVHRVGRTARAGAKGRAVSLVGESGAERRLLKDIVAHSAKTGDCKQRVVPGKVLDSFRKKMADYDEEAHEIVKLEKHEKELRNAEMEATKAANIIEHTEEITARPPRVWFQSEEQKKAAKDASKPGAPAAPEVNPNTKLPKLKRPVLKRERQRKEIAETKLKPNQYKLAKKKHKALGTDRDSKKANRKMQKAKAKSRKAGPARKKQKGGHGQAVRR